MLNRIEVEEGSEIERPESPSFYDELSKKVPWYHRVLLNNPLKVGLALFLFAVVAPTLVFLYLYQNIYVSNAVTDGYSTGTCSHNSTHRIQCGYDNSTAADCPKTCCFDDIFNICYHYLPSRYSYVAKRKWFENVTISARQTNTPYKKARSIQTVRLHIDEINENHLKFLLYDIRKVNIPSPGLRITKKNYVYKVYEPEIFLEIFPADKNDSKPLLSTARGPLVVSENIWEWSFYLSDDAVFGMGHLILKPGSSSIMYNVQEDAHSAPFIMAHRNGRYHGIFLEQTGLLEVRVTGSRVVNVRSLAGNKIGVHFFYGPKPSDVMKQYSAVKGNPIVPPYWALGVHFCRDLSQEVQEDFSSALDFFFNFTEIAAEGKLPYDSDCISNRLFGFVNHELNSTEMNDISFAVETLRNSSKHFLPSLRPHIKFDNESSIFNDMVKGNVLIKDAFDDVPFVGLVDSISVVFPNYADQATIDIMTKSWPFDGLASSFILTDNWPRNDVNRNSTCFVDLPYTTYIINETLCSSIPWNAKSFKLNTTLHMDDHNNYGNQHAAAIYKIASLIRPSPGEEQSFLLTASSFLGERHGTHMQNVDTTWGSLSASFKRAVSGSFQGSHMQSVPVCGDTAFEESESMEQLCIKWYSASVYLPIFRVSSISSRRDPFAFSGFAKNGMINAIKTRYKLLPYFFTVLNKNEPLLRPMFYDFHDDNKTLSLDEQYMVGNAILTAPSFLPSQSSVSVYLPVNETFYDLWEGSFIPVGVNGRIDIPIIETGTVMLIRGGSIIPIQETTYDTAEETRRSSAYTLVVALECHSGINSTCHAKGSMFLANSTYWSFEANQDFMAIHPSIEQTRPHTCTNSTSISSSIIDRIKVYGLNETLNNFGEHLLISNLKLDMCALKNDEFVTVDYVH